MIRPVTADNISVSHAARILRAGGVVAFPTETYYGLAADPFNPSALARLFQVKQRPRQLPILVLVENSSQLKLFTSTVPVMYHLLIDTFWPGPLTLIFQALPTLPDQLTGKTGTVGIRYSPNPTANALIQAFNSPITATSANISGLPAATSAEEISQMFVDGIDLILDGGPTPGGSGSTLVGLDKGRLVCIRKGQIDFARIKRCADRLFESLREYSGDDYE
ncbi:L-threonylcarbamoyladenylate synthase [Desulfobulbus oligotrophicus]|uniref:L-threonylcarbamoyladenylate synthase n=1 Tax=Desulfobulbus oligotrophicus TaxID=1909699 RepID=UPI0022B8E547|nr:L-threonylcarbamoyladenylate synthase [Desulfobulbus oligotrophicus]MDY0391052.1 L-threonylcarbamoyladenylate synthase [Desulfobulbus oligotrophicus]